VPFLSPNDLSINTPSTAPASKQLKHSDVDRNCEAGWSIGRTHCEKFPRTSRENSGARQKAPVNVERFVQFDCCRTAIVTASNTKGRDEKAWYVRVPVVCKVSMCLPSVAICRSPAAAAEAALFDACPPTMVHRTPHVCQHG